MRVKLIIQKKNCLHSMFDNLPHICKIFKNCFFFFFYSLLSHFVTDWQISELQTAIQRHWNKENKFYCLVHKHSIMCVVFFPWKLLLVNIISAYVHYPCNLFIYFFDIILTPFTINWTVNICKAIIWPLMWLAVALQWLIWCPVHDE